MTIIRRGMSAIFALVWGTVIMVGAQAAQCPPILQSLMPKDAVHVTGRYQTGDDVEMGTAEADLPFAAATKSNPYPGRVVIQVTRYKNADMFEAAAAPTEQRTVRSSQTELQDQQATVRKEKTSDLIRMGSISTSAVSGGTIISFECLLKSEDTTLPYAYLKAVGRGNGAVIIITISGAMTEAAEKAAAAEIFANLRKANFGLAGK